jgi:hypothetical protein
MVWNTDEVISFNGISATPAPFTLRGGNYGVSVSATFGGGSVTLQRLLPDAATYVTVMTAFAAAGYANANLPSGTYRLLITTATGVIADIVSAVTTQ